ncbi:sulfurtransferase [Geitlerinema splendidum]|nr:sulfurtransferase [Geitlerinema splendidum]
MRIKPRHAPRLFKGIQFWQSKWFAFFASLLAFAIVIPLSPFFHAQATTPARIQFVSPAWVAQHQQDPNLRILDVRINPLDYINGHIPNAVHIADNTFRGPNGQLPIQYWATSKLQSLFTQAGVTNNSNVLIYSDGPDLLGATMVAYLLERSGRAANVAILDGGFNQYKAAQLPTTKAFPRYELGQFTVEDNPAIRVSLDRVKTLIGKPGVVFIDPRPAALFTGEQDLFIRNGHIPGAKNIPWPTFTLGTDKGFQLKSLSEIEQLLQQRGIRKSDDIIVTCSTGREATLQYVVLKHLLGYPKVRIYEGAWTEYSSHPDLPLETGAGT